MLERLPFLHSCLLLEPAFWLLFLFPNTTKHHQTTLLPPLPACRLRGVRAPHCGGAGAVQAAGRDAGLHLLWPRLALAPGEWVVDGGGDCPTDAGCGDEPHLLCFLVLVRLQSLPGS